MNWFLERRAEIPAGLVFCYAGRFLRVVKTYGTDAAAPVILEEMTAFGTALVGQYALWSADGVMRAINAGRPQRREGELF